MKNLSSDLHPSRRCGGGCGQCGQLPVHQSRFVLEKLAVVQAPVVRPAAKRPGLSTGAALSTARGFGGRWCSRWSRPAPKENSLNLENFCLREVDRFRPQSGPCHPPSHARPHFRVLGTAAVLPNIACRLDYLIRHSTPICPCDAMPMVTVVPPVVSLAAELRAGSRPRSGGVRRRFALPLWPAPRDG